MKLLTVSNPKTAKGAALGYLTAVLHLAPFKASGLNVCPMAELAGCFAGCLNTAGRGGIAKDRARFNPHGLELPDNNIQRCRIARTHYFAEKQAAFMAQLVVEIRKHAKRAAKLGLKAAIRLNGTSDIRWESIPVPHAIAVPVGTTHWPMLPHIFARFPDVQFYDYTKIPNRRVEGIANYSLSLSYSQASYRYSQMIAGAAHEQGRNLVAVFGGPLPETFLGRPVINGDEHDLRFLDPVGVVVGLKAKGAAKRDTSGFVVRV